MGKRIFLFVVFLLCLNIVSAQSLGNQISRASSSVDNFLEGINKEDITLVQGSRISAEDRLLFNIIKSQLPAVQGTKVVKDKVTNVDAHAVVLVGSEKTNQLSKKIVNSQNFTVNRTETYAPLLLRYGYYQDKKVMMIFSQKELIMKQNNAVKKSPLNNFMDEKYVPVVSTFLSILLIYLWKILGETIISFIKDTISSKIISKKSTGEKVSKKKVHKIKPHEFINIKEVIAFIIAVLIFTFTMSYTWSYDTQDFRYMFLLNLVVVFVVSFLREFVRLVFCYKQKLRSEYVLWPFGAFITVLSTVLGNTFSLVSYTLLDEDEADEKKFGKSSFLLIVFTYLLLIVAYILNIINPSVWLQMIFVYSIMMLFLELFPFAPMPGHEIREWNFKTWLVTYIVVFVSYVYLNFTIYI